MGIRKTAIVCLASISWSTGLPAEEQTGVTGTVKDTQGLAVAGVAITLTSAATGFARDAITSRDGRFTLTGVAPGVHSLHARLAGFADVVVEGLDLRLGRTAPLSLVLEPAAVERTVTVSGERPLIETTRAEVATSIPPALIQALPISERNTITLALLAPGVSASPYFDPTKDRDNFDGYSFGATSASSSITLVDGGDNNDDIVGSILQFYPQDSIQEFKVISALFSAEYGRNDGGVVEMITKSGTNRLSGGVYWLARDRELSARSFVERDLGLQELPFHNTVLGGYLGGPIRKDRAFFFANHDDTRRRISRPTTGDGQVPELDDQGALPNDLAQVLDVAKVNAQLTKRQTVTVRYARQADETVNVNSCPTCSASQAGTETNRYDAVLLRDEVLIGNGRRNEVRYHYGRFRNRIDSGARGTPLEGRELNIANTYFLGQYSLHPQVSRQDKHVLGDHFSWRASAAGDHDLRAGVELVHEHIDVSLGSGGPLASFVWDDPAEFRAGAPANFVTVGNGSFFNTATTDDVWSAYLQDDWRPSDRLTLNLGLRYDLWTNEWLQSPDKARLGPGHTFISADPIFFGGQPGTDWNNLGPRLGATYNFGGKDRLVVRGGYGLYYQGIFFNTPGAIPYQEDVLHGYADYAGPEVTFRPSDPFCAAGETGPGCIPVPPLEKPEPPGYEHNGGLRAVDPGIHTPMTHQMSAGLSTQLVGRLVLDLDYVHSQSSDQIYGTFVAGRATVRGLPTANMDPGALVYTQGARQVYNGLLVSAHGDVGRLSTQVSYTFGRGVGHVLRQRGVLDDDRDAEFFRNDGPNFAHRDHQFAAAASLAMRHDFHLGAVVRVQSGFHFSGSDPLLGDVDGDASDLDSIADAALGSRLGCGRLGCFTGDGFQQVDLRLAKSFTLAGHYRPQVFFEVFNLFNTANESPDAVVGNVNATDATGSYLFGESRDFAGQTRQAQLSLRLDF